MRRWTSGDDRLRETSQPATRGDTSGELVLPSGLGMRGSFYAVQSVPPHWVS